MKGAILGLWVLVLLAAPVAVQGQYAYSTNADGSIYTYTTNADGSANIIIYTGPPWAVSIPTNIEGLKVTSIQNDIPGHSAMNEEVTSITIPDSLTSIGSFALFGGSLSNVTIGKGVTNIGDEAFFYCLNLATITVDAQNAFYSSVNGVLFDKSQTSLIQFPTGLGGSYTIPDSVTNIGVDAFDLCFNLTNITLANGVTSIGVDAFASCGGLTNMTIPPSVTCIEEFSFYGCESLTSVYFMGNAPSVGANVFLADSSVTTYYLPSTTGWSLVFWGYPSSGPPAVLWNPLIQTGHGSLGVSNKQFGFNITNGATTKIPIAVEACTNLACPVWTSLTNVMLTNTFHFSDPQWTNYPVRYYGLGFP